MVLGPFLKEGLGRLSDRAFALVVAELVRACVLFTVLLFLAPSYLVTKGEFEKLQRVQVRDRIVKNERLRAMMDCPGIPVTSDRFETCLQLQLDIELDRKKLERRTRRPMAKATAQVMP